MPYFYNTPDDVASMLQAIGVGSIEELFASIRQGTKVRVVK